MMSRLREFFKLKFQYSEPITEQRAQGLLYFLAGLSVLFLLIFFYHLVNIVDGAASFGIVSIFFIALPILCLIFFRMVSEGYYRQAAMGLVGVSLLGVLAGIYPIESFNSLYLALPILGAAVLLGWRSTFISTGLVLALLLISSFDSPADDKFSLFAITSLMLIGMALWLITFGSNIQNTTRRFIREFEQLRRVTKYIKFRGSRSSEEEIALESINLIRDQLSFTFASIYLIEGGGAIRHILGGLNLQQINIEHNIHLQLGNGISEAFRTGEVIQMNSKSSAILREHLLQGTQGALAVPIIEDGKVIGVLDVQSEDLNQFSEHEVETSALIAEQLGLGVSQARLIASLRSELQEQDLLLTQQRSRLLNYERSEQRATTSAWVTYLQQRGIDYMGFDFKDQNLEMVLKDTLDDDLLAALKTGEISMSLDDEIQIVRVPITLRGQSLGAMSFRIPKGSQSIGIRQQELIRSVVQRLALALENKRLFEQSHSQAQRESKANKVGNLLLSSTDIDTVLQMAAEHFNEALGAIQTQIHLRPEASQMVEGEDIS